jgi:4-amino-4-deoxy-L-arabinose transferase-like glycosyltransferase
LTVFVIVWSYYLLRLDETNRRIDAYALGIILGLGMLMKFSFFVYVAAPTIFIAAYRIVQRKSLPEDWKRHCVAIAIIGTMIAGPWYFRNMSRIVHFIYFAGYSDVAKNWSMGDVFSIGTILEYWTYLINYGISLYYFLLLLLAVLLECLRLARHDNQPVLRKEERKISTSCCYGLQFRC